MPIILLRTCIGGHRKATHCKAGFIYNVVRFEGSYMAALPTTKVRIDPALTERENELFDELSISLSATVNVSPNVVVWHKGMPFEPSLEEANESEE